MTARLALLCLPALLCPRPAPAADPAARPDAVARRLARAGANRAELEKALDAVPPAERAGMEFVVAHMPDRDLATLTADFLLANHALAYRARRDSPWAKAVPDDVFLNDVLPYAHVDEKREPWRREFADRCGPMVKDCKTASDAARRLNADLFPALKLKYSPARRAPNQAAGESVASGKASCTGLSVVLADACRAVGVPARLAGVANWHDDRGNHTWVEVWDGGWHFLGAAEPDPAGLDRGWFAADAARATRGDRGHAVYAASFRGTGEFFPLVWDRGARTVPGVDVTDRYAAPKAGKPATARVSVRVVDAAGERVAAEVTVACADCGSVLKGTSRGDGADLNDLLGFDLKPGVKYVVRVGTAEKPVTAGPAGGTQVVEVVAPAPR